MNAVKRSFRIEHLIMILLALVTAVMLFLFISNNARIKELLAEKEVQRTAFQKELDSLLADHERVKEEFGNLTVALHAKDSIIQANAVEIRKLLDTQWEYVKVQRKLAQLRRISQGYLRQMDSLYTVNRELMEENVHIRASFERERRIVQDLQKDKATLTDKVELASVLQAININTTGLITRGGAEREGKTDRTRRLDKIRVCFQLANNPVAPPGKRDLYIRIARPDEAILQAGYGDEFAFIHNGEVLQYSMKETIEYNNKPVSVCANWIYRDRNEPLQAGVYSVTIFCDDNIIGQAYFELR